MWLEGDVYEFRKAVPRQWMRLGAAAKVLGTIKAPMPGKIIQVTVLAAPQRVGKGGGQREVEERQSREGWRRACGTS